jgi:hypothetical protein
MTKALFKAEWLDDQDISSGDALNRFRTSTGRLRDLLRHNYHEH